MTDQIFATTAPAYYAKGVPVIPLYSRDKRPVPMDWSQYHDKPVSAETQNEWVRGIGNGNIGVVLGAQSRMSMLDIDTEDENLIKVIKALVPDSPWVRIGQKGMVLAFRHTGIKTFRIKTSSGETLCELLSDRTQVVLPPSIHPKTQQPYTANCELLDVIDRLPALPSNIEEILRTAFAEEGVELSISGASKLTDFVSAGSRDTTLTQHAGLFAYAVMRGERSLKEAIGMLRSFNTEFVESVAGDAADIEKHVLNLIRFIHRDVFERKKQLPEGWDAGLSEEEKKAYGVDFAKENEQWSFDEMRDHMRKAFMAAPDDEDVRLKAVEEILARMAISDHLTAIEEGRLLKYMAEAGNLNIRQVEARARLKELRTTEVVGADHSEIARAVLEDFQAIKPVAREAESLWEYTGSHWEKLPDDVVMAKIAQDYGSLQAARRHSDHNGIFKTLNYIAPKGLTEIHLDGVNFANGFVTDKLELLPHEQGHGMTYTLPFRYMPELAGKMPHFNQFLADCWGHDPDFHEKMDALQEALCVTLFGMGPRFQRVVLLKGVGKSGKSQLLKIAAALVPDTARCSVPPNDWADRFLPTQMHNKLLNICGELSERKKIDGQQFKDIVDGTERTGQYKGQQIFTFKPMCVHWFASNHNPKTDDGTDGFNRRWLILEFNRPVAPEKRRTDIGDLIVAEEREAIVAWAVLAMPRLLRQQEYTLPESHKQMIREIAQTNNSVRFFLEESPKVRIVRDSQQKTGVRITEEKLYKEYWAFCFGPGGARPVGSKAFREAMKEMQFEKGFALKFETNPLGMQAAWYDSITLADG